MGGRERWDADGLGRIGEVRGRGRRGGGIEHTLGNKKFGDDMTFNIYCTRNLITTRITCHTAEYSVTVHYTGSIATFICNTS